MPIFLQGWFALLSFKICYECWVLLCLLSLAGLFISQAGDVVFFYFSLLSLMCGLTGCPVRWLFSTLLTERRLGMDNLFCFQTGI